jgi:predicted nucleic acid-binding protein
MNTTTISTKPTVYVETSVISYLTNRPSRDVVALAHQQTSQDFWDARAQCDMYASDMVVSEASEGDSVMAQKRLDLLQHTILLQTTDEARQTAQALIEGKAIPRGSEEDALHVAICAVYGIDYLLTWNCKHIANPVMQEKIRHILVNQCQLKPAYLITPEVFLQIQTTP